MENQDDRHDGLHLMTRRFQASRDLTMVASGREIHVERGGADISEFPLSLYARGASLAPRSACRFEDQAGEIPSADGKVRHSHLRQVRWQVEYPAR